MITYFFYFAFKCTNALLKILKILLLLYLSAWIRNCAVTDLHALKVLDKLLVFHIFSSIIMLILLECFALRFLVISEIQKTHYSLSSSIYSGFIHIFRELHS